MRKILFECFNDETLCSVFNISKNDMEHYNNLGKGKILERIQKRNNCTALIDNDKGTNNTYLFKSKLIEDISENIKVFYESVNKNYIIVFYPHLEKIIESLVESNDSNKKIAEKLKIDCSSKSLHNIGMDKTKLSKLKNLLIALKSRCPEISSLEKYLV